MLNIDEDGDGKYDLKLQAGVNGYGEEVKIDRGIYIILAYAFISALIITIIVRRITIQFIKRTTDEAIAPNKAYL